MHLPPLVPRLHKDNVLLDTALEQPRLLTGVADAAIHVNKAVVQLQFAQHDLEQCGLARTHRANYGAQNVGLDADAHVRYACRWVGWHWE